MARKKKERNGVLIDTDEAKLLYSVNQSPQMDKYVSPFLNQVNGWAGGTKPENVGMVSQVIKDFRKAYPNGTLEDWKQYHNNLGDIKGIDQSVINIRAKLDDVLNNLNNISDDAIREWVENLTYEKTYSGLSAQEQILSLIATNLGKSYQLGDANDEKQGIDGYVNGKPLQIKSSSYRNKNKLEKFSCPIVFYDLTKEGIVFDYNDELKNYING